MTRTRSWMLSMVLLLCAVLAFVTGWSWDASDGPLRPN
jgi:hypothetical protein